MSIDAGPDGLALRISGEPVVVRLTRPIVPVSPPIVATETTDLDPVGGYTPDTVNGASVNGVRTPMELTGRARRCPWSATTAVCPT